MRYVYLHGFASGPSSGKARILRESLARNYMNLEIPMLDCGDFEHLTISGQLEVLSSLLQGEPACVLGSSMGGYLAALYSSAHPEVARVVMLAPAFGLRPLFERTLLPDTMAAWRETGWMEVFHHSTGELRRVHYGLLEDARRHPAFPSFRQPALLFHGRHDDVVPISASREWAQSHPNAEFLELDSDHQLLDVIDAITTRTVPFLLATAASNRAATRKPRFRGGTSRALPRMEAIMRLHMMVAAAFLGSAVLIAAAEHPSFAGNWLLDTARSTGAASEWSGMQIGQNGRWFRMAETDKNGRQVKTLEGECQIDGRFHPVQGGEGGSISCKWDGSTLVIREHWGENDQNERTIRTMLQPDGTLVQEIAATGPGAARNVHLVWRKQ